jgi:hypothetical protein
MITFPGQFNGFRVTATGDRILSFRIDELYADNVKDIISAKIGTEYIVTLIDVTGDTDLGTETNSETLKERFWNKMHALLSEWAETIGDKPENTKIALKDWLKVKKLIATSTKELDLRGLAVACNYIEQQIKKSKS